MRALLPPHARLATSTHSSFKCVLVLAATAKVACCKCQIVASSGTFAPIASKHTHNLTIILDLIPIRHITSRWSVFAPSSTSPTSPPASNPQGYKYILPDAGAWRTALLPLILFPFACCSVLLRLHDIAGWRGRGDSGSSISAHKPLLMRFAQLLPFTSAHTQTHTPWQLNVEMIVRFCFFKCKCSQVRVCVCGCGRVRALQFVASLNAIFAVK